MRGFLTIMATKTTQYALNVLRKEGWYPEVVEYWNSFARIRKDLLGFIDILAFKDGEVLALQVTSRSNISSRVRKIADMETLPLVRESGWVIQVWGVDKGKNGRYRHKVVDIS
jgi:hypothetical protein